MARFGACRKITSSTCEDMKMTVAVYIRVSTRRQNDDGQRADVKKWLDANGIDSKKVECYCDKESGTSMKRVEYGTAPIFDASVAERLGQAAETGCKIVEAPTQHCGCGHRRQRSVN